MSCETFEMELSTSCYWLQNRVLGHSLLHSVDKTNLLVVTVELIWLLFMNILSLNFVSTLNKSLSFTRLRSSYVNRLAVILIKVTLHFCLMRAVQSGHIPFFCSCLLQMIVHLCNLLLLNTPFAQVLLTPRWVSGAKHYETGGTKNILNYNIRRFN